jgi:hypothetical protein
MVQRPRHRAIQAFKVWLLDISESLTESALATTRPILRVIFRNRFIPGSVLHVSVMVHTAYQAATTLRAQGINAKYLAIGASPIWNKSDYILKRSRWSFINKWREFVTFWRIISRYEIVHAHFMLMPSESVWEAAELKQLGRKLVAHFRGCEARNRELNMRLHRKINICQECDHAKPLCKQDSSVRRRAAAENYADAVLVTTPDMLDFYPQAEHVPFFTPVSDSDLYSPIERPEPSPDRPFKIVHVTVHPGIEGTRHIQDAVDRLNARGYRIEFVYLNWVSQDVIRNELATADLAIGKMKMGYYANSQIESMMMGVPTVTYMRDEFMSPALKESGFIFANIDELDGVIAYYIDHPAELEKKRNIARSSIQKLHDNHAIARQLIDIYGRLSPNFEGHSLSAFKSAPAAQAPGILAR